MGPRFTDALVARYMGASSPSADEHSSPERPRSRSAVVSSSSKPGDQARQSAPRATVASLPRGSRTGKDSDSSGDELHRPSKTGELSADGSGCALLLVLPLVLLVLLSHGCPPVKRPCGAM
jgi:hypothetical protein